MTSSPTRRRPALRDGVSVAHPERPTTNRMAGGASEQAVIRTVLYVRPRARPGVGGTYADALLVKVPQPAHQGKATAAALAAVSEALGLAPRSVILVRGATTRRKVIDITVPTDIARTVKADLVRLRSS